MRGAPPPVSWTRTATEDAGTPDAFAAAAMKDEKRPSTAEEEPDEEALPDAPSSGARLAMTPSTCSRGRGMPADLLARPPSPRHTHL